MDIVFNINYLGLEGLGATLSSLIRNCSNTHRLIIWFFCSGVAEKDKANLRQLLKEEHFNGASHFIDFNAKEIFGRFRSLHGDWTTYGRLLIGDHVKADRALYLDADLLITVDLLALEIFDFQDRLVAAVNGGRVGSALDRSLLMDKLNWTPEMRYFNCGVLLFNLERWRTMNAKEICLSIAEKHSNDLVSHDQTILNVICGGEFAALPPNYNCAWYPGEERPEAGDRMIIHFVGSPKPWDLFGRLVHKGYSAWRKYDPPEWRETYGRISVDKVKRAWKIKNSILVQLKKRFTGS